MTDLFRRSWFWGLVGLAVVMTVFVVFALLGWPGQADSCTLPGGNCYCEAYPRGAAAVKQPANTWSGLFAALAGVIILILIDRDRRSPSPATSPMTAGGFYAITYGALVIFLGPGAMFFHAGLTKFGGWLDNMSMVLYVCFLLLYDAGRIFRLDDRKGLFIAAYAAVIVLLGILVWVVDGFGTIAFAVLAISALIVQAIILIARPNSVSRSFLPWLLLGFIAFGIAFPIWLLSWTGGAICDPTSAFQGHAIWHLLGMAATPFFIFFYLRGETRT